MLGTRTASNLNLLFLMLKSTGQSVPLKQVLAHDGTSFLKLSHSESKAFHFSNITYSSLPEHTQGEDNTTFNLLATLSCSLLEILRVFFCLTWPSAKSFMKLQLWWSDSKNSAKIDWRDERQTLTIFLFFILSFPRAKKQYLALWPYLLQKKNHLCWVKSSS